MIITRLKLKDFLSHENTELEFNQGTTVIVGVNGAGKSSILDAVSFALYKHNERGSKLDDLIRKGSNSLSVELDFIANGRKYRIIRKRRREGSSEAVLKEITNGNMTTIVRKTAGVDRELKKILNMDMDLFLNAIYVRQGEIAKLLDQDPAERKRLVGRLLQIEELNKVWERFKDIISHFKVKEAELKGEAHRLKDVVEELKKQEKEALEVKEKLERVKKEYNQLKQQRDKLKELYDTLEKKKIEFTRLSSEHERYGSQIIEIKKDIDSFKQRIEEIEKDEAKLKEIKELAMQYESLEKAHELNTELLVLEEKLKAAESDKNQITEYEATIKSNEENFKRFNSLEKDLTKLEEEINALTVQYETLKNKLKDRENLQNEIRELKGKLNEVSEKLNALGITGDLKSQIEIGVSKKKTLEEEIVSKNKQLTKLKKQTGTIEGTLDELNKMMKKIKMSKNRCPVCGSKLTEAHRKQILNEYSEKIEKNTIKLDELQNNIKSLSEAIDTSEKMLKQLKELNLELSQMYLTQHEEKTSMLEELNKELEKLKILEEQLKQKEKQKERITEEKNALQEAHDKYTFAVNALKNFDKEKVFKQLKDLEEERKELVNTLRDILTKVGISNIKELETIYKAAKEAKEEYTRLEERVKQKSTILSSIEDKEKLLESYEEKLKDIQMQLKNLGYSEEEHNKVKKQRENFEQKIKSVEANISTLNERLRIANKRISDLRKEIEEIKKKSLKAEKVAEFVEMLRKIREIFGKDGIQSIIRQRAIPIIEAHTREIFQEFGLSYSDIKIDEDFNITLYGPGFEQSVSALSGGEKSVVAFALRMGIARTLADSNLDMIMLDEPTAYLDTYRKEELVNVLSKIRGIPQVILVTQEEALKEIADTLIQVDKVGGKSKVKVVEIQEKEGTL